MDVMSFSAGSYYQHSGKFSVGGLLRATLYGLLIGIPLAWLYARLIHWNPFGFINALATFAVGGLVGAATASFLDKGQCRNTPVAALVVFVVMLVSWYVSWAVWLHARTDTLGVFELLLAPDSMMGVIRKINELGSWSMRGTVVTGITLWVVWGVEAVTLFGAALYLTVNGMRQATFCEGCGQMAKATEGIGFVSAGTAPDAADRKAVKAWAAALRQHAADLKQHLETKNFSYLEELGAVPADALAWYRADLTTCEKCNATHTLRVLQFRRKVESGKATDRTEDHEVLKHLLLSAAEARTLRSTGEKLVPAPPRLAGLLAKTVAGSMKKPAA